MTQPWWYYWWDLTVLAQIQAVFSVVGALLAVLAVVYAWRVARKQFKLADEQGKIIDKQLTILEEHRNIFLRLEESERKQEGFLEAQARIADAQQRILAQQAIAAAKLAMYCRHNIGDFVLTLVNEGELTALKISVGLLVRGLGIQNMSLSYGMPIDDPLPNLFKMQSSEPDRAGMAHSTVLELELRPGDEFTVGVLDLAPSRPRGGVLRAYVEAKFDSFDKTFRLLVPLPDPSPPQS